MKIVKENEIIIRPTVREDLPSLCKIFQNDLGYPECTMEILIRQFENLNPEREAVFSAVFREDFENVVCGVIHVEKYNVLYFPTMANILGLAVAEDFRRNGIGRKLLAHAEQWAKKNDIKQMRLNSGSRRIEAHEFYRAQGYKDDKMQLRFVKEMLIP